MRFLHCAGTRLVSRRHPCYLHRATFSGASPSLLINTINETGKVDWNDRVKLQSRWSNDDKGWRVSVEWRQTTYGAGVFAMQDIAAGTILRHGRIDTNLKQFKSAQEMRDFCKDDSGCECTAGTNSALVAYVGDYFYGFNPGVGETWYGIWVPGNGLNHSEDANTVYLAAEGGLTTGINLVALTDVRAGTDAFWALGTGP